MGHRIGIDLGGTKIEAALFDRSNTDLFRKRINTPKNDYRATLEAIRDLVLEAEQSTGLEATVGVGIPGTISPQSGLVKNANSTWLIGKPLDKDLSHLLERPIRFANDANCFALSEAVDGAAKDARVVFGVILGTGCGGGIVVNRTVLVGANAIGGEWGHTPLPAPTADEIPGPACYCGRRGCLETWISGPAFEAQYANTTGIAASAADITSRAIAGDMKARACFDLWLGRLGRGLAGIINVLDPDIIVLGGGLSNIPLTYQHIDAAVHPHVFSDVCTTPIVQNQHGDSSGVRGAAWLWNEDEAA